MNLRKALFYYTRLSTTNKNFSQDFQQTGRSMIEMLGVLAIIGVLSIGGIAGFSKAMYNYKLTKQAEQYSLIISAVWEKEEGLITNSTSGAGSIITSTFYSIGLIPKEMKKNNNSYFYDIFDNKGFILHGNTSHYYLMRIEIKNKPFEQCKNILEVIKAYHDFIAAIQISKASSGNNYNTHYGDSFCTGTKKCINDMNPSQMNEFCSLCNANDSDVCYLSIYLSSIIKNNTAFK